MILEQPDIDVIERLIYKSAEEIAISMARASERIIDRIESTESRLYTRISEIDDALQSVQPK